jgi:RND family efflux transporter MFP subunit
LARLRAFQGYEQLRAPFEGVVTQRFVDPGALVQAQGPVVEITDATRVKITVYVGQDVAPFLKAGDAAEVRQQERPDLRVSGKVTRISDALDPRSRTMLTEVWLDNREIHLQPGTFVKVTLRVVAPALPTIPIEAIFVRGAQVLTAVVKDGSVKFTPVELGINDGQRLQIRSGLQGGEQVALNVPSELDDGTRVRAVPLPKRSPATGK